MSKNAVDRRASGVLTHINQHRSRCSSTMRRSEQEPSTTTEKPFTFFGLFNFSLLESSPFSTKTQKNKLWTSQRYVEAGALQTKPNPDHSPILRELSVDLQSFFDEHAALMSVVKYDYGPNGIQNGYSQSMAEIAQHHLEFQQLNDLPLERASLELAVAQTVEAWMADEQVEVGARLASISPRGTKPEGYPGLDLRNYALVNVFEKTKDGFVLQQYRSYDPNQYFPQLQDKLLESCSGKLLLAAQPHTRQDLTTINSLVEVPPTFDLSQIEHLVYAHKKKWKVNIDTQLPKLDLAQYQALTNQTVQFCLKEFEQLLEKSADTETTIKHFDLLILTVKESVTKWTETHAQNYEQTEDTHELNFDQIKVTWQARCAQADGQHMTKEQKSLLKKFENVTALNPALPLQKMTSWAHCIVGSPTSLLKLQNPKLMKALQLNNLSKGQLTEFIGAERAQLWKQGRCQRCGSEGMVGECSICLNCELELGGQTLPKNLLQSAQDQLLGLLAGEEKITAQALFAQLSELVLRKTVSFEQLLHGDFIDPTATVTAELEPKLNRLFFAPNPLHELQLIVAELSGKDMGSEQNNSEQKKFNFDSPQPAALAA